MFIGPGFRRGDSLGNARHEMPPPSASPPALPPAEIFRSIQGEGVNMGRVRTFVRFSGCNLHCVWCDTPYLELARHELAA